MDSEKKPDDAPKNPDNRLDFGDDVFPKVGPTGPVGGPGVAGPTNGTGFSEAHRGHGCPHDPAMAERMAQFRAAKAAEAEQNEQAEQDGEGDVSAWVAEMVNSANGFFSGESRAKVWAYDPMTGQMVSTYGTFEEVTQTLNQARQDTLAEARSYTGELVKGLAILGGVAVASSLLTLAACRIFRRSS